MTDKKDTTTTPPPTEPEVPNMIANYVKPPYGYTKEDIVAMPEASKSEVAVWLQNRTAAVRAYHQRTKLDTKLCAWYFMSMNYLARTLLPETVQQPPPGSGLI